MDASDNIARLRAGYAAFNAGDDAATVANIDPEIEVYEPPELPDTKVWHGQEGYLAALRNMREVFGEISVEPEEFVELGDQVVVVARMVVRGLASGAEATRTSVAEDDTLSPVIGVGARVGNYTVMSKLGVWSVLDDPDDPKDAELCIAPVPADLNTSPMLWMLPWAASLATLIRAAVPAIQARAPTPAVSAVQAMPASTPAPMAAISMSRSLCSATQFLVEL